MKKLYYMYICFPQCVRLYGDKETPCATYNPWDIPEQHWNKTPEAPLTLKELFAFIKNKQFRRVEVLLDEDNDAYYRDENGEEVSVVGWIDLADYEDGGNFTNDPLW